MALRALPESGSPSGSPIGRLRPGDAARLRRYRQFRDFYEGRHFDRPRAGRATLVLNYARTVVDKGVAYLLGRGLDFAVLPSREELARDRRRAERAERLLYDVYWDNDLDAVDLQVAQNAGVLGDGVYKVFWDAIGERIRVVGIDPSGFFATWAADDPGRVLRVEVAYRVAAEAWDGFAASAGVGGRGPRSGTRSFGLPTPTTRSSSAGRTPSWRSWSTAGWSGASRTRTDRSRSSTSRTSSRRTSSGGSPTWST